MSRRCLQIAVGAMWGVTVLVLASALILPRLVFWMLERYAQREGNLQ